MNCPDFIGQTLDGKYQMTRELGSGGMGKVYLATHLGTERPVAVKVIAPQYMQRSEFVERFRREARAAGRLRHPNVVNVTDFGFAESREGQVAYLVMEYLDGCTLGEILDEEKNLPVAWTLDILEQVCSAVQEAHEQGIIHRDLKPDNIWLEPNQRGGYTVKVLDFGIAKLEEHGDPANGDRLAAYNSTLPTIASGGLKTHAGDKHVGTIVDRAAGTEIPVAKTAVQGVQAGKADLKALSKGVPVAEGETAVFDDGDISRDFQDVIQTRVLSEDVSIDDIASRLVSAPRSIYDASSSGELTRVGAVLGTPLYMSPEQCKGEFLDARSDIYSLGVIAYQMLSGAPPFSGDFKDVMEAHKSTEPLPLDAKHVRRKMKRAIHAALSKHPDERPQTAEAFASVMRARAEGIFGLLRRALVIYSEHLPKFLMLTTFFSAPIIVLTLTMVALAFLKVSGLLDEGTSSVLVGIVGFVLSVVSAFCTNLIVGTNAWIVTQYLAVPLRPVRIRPALAEARKKWKRIAGSGLLTAVLPFVVAAITAIVVFIGVFAVMLLLYPLTHSVQAAAITAAIAGACAGLIGFLGAYAFWTLVPAVVMLENVRIVEALRRSRALVRRSLGTTAGAVFIMILIPAIIAGGISLVVNLGGKALDPTAQTSAEASAKTSVDAEPTEPETTADEKKPGLRFSLGRQPTLQVGKDDKQDMASRVKSAVLESLIQLLWLPMQIIVFSFSAIIVALLYLKTRLAGGESMNDLIERFEDNDRPRKKWQERVRQRLIQSGRIPSKP
jgi:serine/threonine protein kinase